MVVRIKVRRGMMPTRAKKEHVERARANVVKASVVATTKALTGMMPTRVKKAHAAEPSSHT